MGLDLRLPLGLMFSTIGVILLGYGVFTRGSGQYAVSLGMNVNVGWGVVMLVVGVAIFLLGWRSRARELPAQDKRSNDMPHRHSH